MHSIMQRLIHLKSDFFPLLLIFSAQLWLSLNYPRFMHLNPPYNVMLSIISCIFCILLYSMILAFSENRKPFFNFDDFYHDRITFLGKNMGGLCFLLMSHITMFVVWYYDFYKASNSYYAVLYVQGVLVFGLLDRSAKRYIKSNNKICA